MDNNFPQLPPLYRDSEGLRTNMIAQRNKFLQQQQDPTLALPPRNFHKDLQIWANQPVKAVLLPQKAKNIPLEMPLEPSLSYTRMGVRGDENILIQNQQRHEKARNTIIQEFTHYTDTLISSTYEDLADFRTKFQYQMSGIEHEFGKIVTDQEKTPQLLTQAIREGQNTATLFLDTLQKQITSNEEILTNSIKSELVEVSRKLLDECCTEEDVKQYLQYPLSDFKDKYCNICRLIEDFVSTSRNRIYQTVNDYYAQATRIMINRRKRAAESLIRDFRAFVIDQNEWSIPLVEQINTCNCQAQQMSSNFYDALSKIEHIDRVQLYDLIRVYLKDLYVNKQNIQDLQEIYEEIKQLILNGCNQTVDRLKQIQMPGSSYCQEIVDGWQNRWTQRIDRLKEVNNKQIQSNSFYICGIITLFKQFEDIKIQQSANNVNLVQYFDDCIQAIESRFQRDLQRYETTIEVIEHQYQTIWNPNDASSLQQIALKMIESMDKVVKSRQETLESLSEGDQSLFTQIIYDKMIEQLSIYGELILADNVQIENYTNQNYVKWDQASISIDQLDKIIADRGRDAQQQQIQEAVIQNTDKSPSSKKQVRLTQSPSRQNIAKKEGRQQKDKQMQYTLNSDGLYVDLPKFSDIDQNEALRQYGFSFNNTNVGYQQLKDAVRVMIFSSDKKQLSKKKDDVLFSSLQDIEIGQQSVNLEGANRKIKISYSIIVDLRVIIQLSVLQFMQEEGKRQSFNATRIQFLKQLEEYKAKYLEILNTIQDQQYKEAMEKYNKEKAAVEKRNKQKKSGQTLEPIEEPPVQNSKLTSLPEDVQEKIQSIPIPNEELFDESNVYLKLVYLLLDYDELKQLPSTDQCYNIEIDDFMFSTEINPTPSISRQPTRPNTGKQQKPQEKQVQKGDQRKQLTLPRPSNVKKIFTDSRLVVNGQSGILSVLFHQIIRGEFSSLLTETEKLIRHYQHEGGYVKQRCARDTYQVNLLMQSHKMLYTQKKPQEIQLLYSQRNGVLRRTIERARALYCDLALKYLQCDTRFVQMGLLNGDAQNAQPAAQAVSSQSPNRKPGPATPKRDGNSNKTSQNFRQQAEEHIRQCNIGQYVQLQFDEGKVTQIQFQDALGQDLPFVRSCVDEFVKFVQIPLSKLAGQQSQLLHKQITQCSNAFVSAAVNKILKLLHPGVIQQIGAFQKELQLQQQNTANWGTKDQVIDFSFADEPYALISNQYDTPYKSVVKLGHESHMLTHPFSSLSQQLIDQLALLREDIYSSFLQGVRKFRLIFSQLADSVQLGNQLQINQALEFNLTRRKTSNLNSLIVGRISTIEYLIDKLQHKNQAASQIIAGGQLPALGTVGDLIHDLLLAEHYQYLLSYQADVGQCIGERSQSLAPRPADIYLQRQKYYNCKYAMILVVFALFDKIFGGQSSEQDGSQGSGHLDSVFAAVSDLTPQKAAAMKSRVYADNSKVDVITQLGQEFGALQLPDGSQAIEQLKSDISGALCGARQKLAGLQAQLRRAYDGLLCTIYQSIQSFAATRFAQQAREHSTRIQQIQDQFLKGFDEFYQKLRPGLAKYPEKQQQVQGDAKAFYGEQTRQLSALEEQEPFSQQIRLLQLVVAVFNILYQYDNTGGQLNQFLQLNAYLDCSFAQQREKSKTPAESKQECVIAEYLPQIFDKTDQFPACFVKTANLVSKYYYGNQIIFDFSVVDTKAAISAKPSLLQAQLFDKIPTLQATPQSNPKQVTGGKPKSAKKDEQFLPYAAQLYLKEITVRSSELQSQYQEKAQILVTDNGDDERLGESQRIIQEACLDGQKQWQGVKKQLDESKNLAQLVFNEFNNTIKTINQQ